MEGRKWRLPEAAEMIGSYTPPVARTTVSRNYSSGARRVGLGTHQVEGAKRDSEGADGAERHESEEKLDISKLHGLHRIMGYTGIGR